MDHNRHIVQFSLSVVEKAASPQTILTSSIRRLDKKDGEGFTDSVLHCFRLVQSATSALQCIRQSSGSVDSPCSRGNKTSYTTQAYSQFVMINKGFAVNFALLVNKRGLQRMIILLVVLLATVDQVFAHIIWDGKWIASRTANSSPARLKYDKTKCQVLHDFISWQCARWHLIHELSLLNLALFAEQKLAERIWCVEMLHFFPWTTALPNADSFIF